MIPASFRRRRRLSASFWLRCSYWWYFAAVGCFVPYIALYYRHLGLSGLEIGVLTAILPLGTALLAPLWGALADSFAAHRLALRTALIMTGLTALAVTRATHFWSMLPLMLLLALSVAAVPALLDGYAMTISEREGRSYGQLRVWGSLGFIVAVTVVGWQMGGDVSSFFLIAYAVGLLLAFGATFGLPPLHPRAKQPMWQGVAQIVSDRPVALLLLTTFLVTSNASIMTNYLGIYLIEVGGNARIVGTASALAAIFELPVLLFGAWLLDRFTSQRVLLLGIAVYFVRFILFGIPPAPTWVLSVQTLHGLSYGAYLMASVTLIHQLAGRERAATAQGLLTATSFGFGAITGSLVGGALLDRIGAVGIFRMAAVGMLVAWLVGLYSTRQTTRAPLWLPRVAEPQSDQPG